MKKNWLVVLTFLLTEALVAQLSPAALKLKNYKPDSSSVIAADSSSPALYKGGGLHYLAPLYENFNNTATGAGKDNLARHLGFAGDHLLANYYLEKSYDSMMTIGYQDADRYIDTMKSLQLVDAKSWILQRAAGEKAVFFNENAAQMQQRAFFYSLLEDFYKLGFHYLSVYWLSPLVNPNTTQVSKYLGYQVADPVAAEIVRKARSLGFTLVPYGDSSIQSKTGNVQDAVQATRLASLLQQDTAARLLVLDEQAHIAERNIGNFSPMATVFTRLTGINPLTVDQTELSTGSSFEYGRYFYNQLSKKLSIDQVSVVLRDKTPVSLLENDLYDLQLLFPPVRPLYGRAEWLTLSGKRKPVAVQPAHRELFFVQAYYEDETMRSLLPDLVPADQTYLTDKDGYYRLFLHPGKYTLVYRDIHYRILSEKELVVKEGN